MSLDVGRGFQGGDEGSKVDGAKVGRHTPKARGRGARKGAPAKVTMHTGGGALSTAATRRGRVLFTPEGKATVTIIIARAVLKTSQLDYRHNTVSYWR